MSYFLSKIKQKFVTHNHETICEFYRRGGGVKVGKIILYAIIFQLENQG